ncbi:MAG: hypothetical protein A3A86_03535 [Elusimicrobia bacterium RIFCSPLOWO2_01_FULL_60_11]|nr:MAG: hypothetical protein A3A86_03535 [Elusimicrobia bacterium RIFCSPLOWO2_01_FULL_60_11]
MKKSAVLFLSASFSLLLLALAAPAGAGQGVRLDPSRTELGGFGSSSSGGNFRFQSGYLHALSKQQFKSISNPTGSSMASDSDVTPPAVAVSTPADSNKGIARKLVLADEGGTLADSGKNAVTIPPLAMSVSTEISVTRIELPDPIAEELKESGREELNIKAVSPQLEFGPEGTQFDRPVTITIGYDPLLLGSRSESDLKITYWNPISMKWELLASSVDAANKTVSAQVIHFSLYQVHAVQMLAAAAAAVIYDDRFNLGEVYSFPNPARGKDPTLHLECGLADSIEIRIHDIARELVHASRMSGAEWRVVNGKYAYEYLWNVSGIASGVYIYTIRAKKTGSPDINVRKKLAVVK